MRFCFGFAIVLVATSCEVILNVEPPKNPNKLVATSVFNPDSVFRVTVSSTRSILYTGYGFDRMDNAIVTILDENNNPLDETTQSIAGEYRLTIKPEVGKIYRIKVVKEGFPAIQASSSIPQPVAIQSIAIDTGNFETKFKIRINDPAETKNYYKISLYSKYAYTYRNPITNETFTRVYRTFSDLFQESSDLTNGENRFIFDDAKFNGQEHTFNLVSYFGSVGTGNSGNTTLELGIVLQTMNEDYYQYLRTIRIQNETQGDPFAQPVQVYNNIQNGYGIFGGYSTSFYNLKK